MTAAAPAEKPPFTLTGWHVLAMVVAFFAVVIGVDAVMITQAYRTFSGQVAKNPYEAGLAFNRTLAQRRAEAALGWTVTAADTPDRRVALTFTGPDGKPLEGLAVTGVLERPATETGKVTLAFEAVAPGVYRSRPVARGGAWDLSATARNGRGDLMEAQRRFTWP